MKRCYDVPGRCVHAGERCSHRHECVLVEKYNKGLPSQAPQWQSCAVSEVKKNGQHGRTLSDDISESVSLSWKIERSDVTSIRSPIEGEKTPVMRSAMSSSEAQKSTRFPVSVSPP